ncbi:uncharacterized protein LOC128982790 isoform X2 [Macrosteles quadrilineatus]|uniref:uncharacterized protein LOC128982790 isoform X2 n=1 Tax=Macrosteles quadrilineatus TaxID=74068 RepID=UPI0023E24AAC|nr:uncharacterized protein LOC128982790 isoform X2 [Macrosteles quadrilineatus]
MTRMGSASQGDTNPRRTRGGKQGALYSDYYEDEKEETQAPQRSISLMASIEVSLSTTPRRKKAATAPATPTAPTTHTPPANNLFRSAKDVAQELELLRTTLRDKENVIHSLKGQLCTSLSINRLSATFLQRQASSQPLTEKERRAAEDRLSRLRAELDTKRLAIKNIKLALERLDITDNIDVRIQQAELEYQLGREELNLLSILEESRNLQAALESSNNRESATIFNYVKDSSAVTLHAVELVFDPKSPRFGAAPRDDNSGLYVEWAVEDSGLIKGDRLLEANGKVVLCKSKDELFKLLAVSPNPAQLVVMRRQPPHLEQLMSSLRAELLSVREKAGEAERTRDSFRSDNLRLTHRISYLEEQVADLLERAREEIRPQSSNASTASSVKSPSPRPEVQVFQKGPQVALVANLPGLEVGNKSATETKQLPTVKAPNKLEDSKLKNVKSLEKISASDTEKRRRSKKKESHLYSARSTNSLDVESTIFAKCHKHNQTHFTEKNKNTDYSSETLSEKNSHRRHSESMEQRQKHIRDARSSLFDLNEKEKINHKLDFEPELNYNRPSSCQPMSKIETVSQKSLDYSSESSSRYYKKHSDPRVARPVPPKKPLRLSLHRATSLQSVENGDKKPIKRNHKGEAPLGLWPTAVASLQSATYRSKSSLAEKWC